MSNIKNIIKNRIYSYLKEINQILLKDNNEILLFDYTYAVYRHNKLIDIQSYYFHGTTNYHKLLQDYIIENGNSIALSKKSKKRNIDYFITNPVNVTQVGNVEFGSFTDHNKNYIDIAPINTWHKYITDKKFGGYAITIFYQVNIETVAGIYLVLSKNVAEEFLNEITSKIKNVIYEFLLDEGWVFAERLYSKYKKIQEEQFEFLTQRHSIFNIPFTEAIENLGLAFEYNSQEKIKSSFQNIKKYSELQNLVLFNAFKPNHKAHPLAGKSIVQIIEKMELLSIKVSMNIIKENISNDFILLSVNDYIKAKNSHQKEITESYNLNFNRLIDGFTILLNLWFNARKKYEPYKAKSFDVIINSLGGELIIVFKNRGKISEENLKYVNTESELPPKEMRGQGLRIIKNKCSGNSYLKGWKVKAANLLEEDVNWVLFTLTINKKQ